MLLSLQASKDNHTHMSSSQDALTYHAKFPPGKLGISPTKSLQSAEDLSLAYTPGVAAPCQAIATDPRQAYRYTAKGNLIAIVTDGSAVLGLGNIGPQAAKPVMEGKAVLCQHFAGVDAYDVEVEVSTSEALVATVTATITTTIITTTTTIYLLMILQVG